MKRRRAVRRTSGTCVKSKKEERTSKACFEPSKEKKKEHTIQEDKGGRKIQEIVMGGIGGGGGRARKGVRGGDSQEREESVTINTWKKKETKERNLGKLARG